jgi:hypothetical protein
MAKGLSGGRFRRRQWVEVVSNKLLRSGAGAACQSLFIIYFFEDSYILWLRQFQKSKIRIQRAGSD